MPPRSTPASPKSRVSAAACRRTRRPGGARSPGSRWSTPRRRARSTWASPRSPPPPAPEPSVNLQPDEIEQLYRAPGHVLLRRARALLGNDADAQEALQEVFAALLDAPDGIRSRDSVISWLYGATTHHCLNVMRKRRNGARLVELHVVPHLVTAGRARADALAEVRAVLGLLPDEVAAAVVYFHLDGMTYDEIAEQLGCSRRKVGYLLERAQGVLSLERERAEQTA